MIKRLYTGEDGKSHLDEISLESNPELTSVQDADSIQFRATEVGYFMDWHTAPRRQFIIVLSGEMEIGLEDGSLHSFVAGDVLLAEDLTGKGHTTRSLGGVPRVSATIPLAD